MNKNSLGTILLVIGFVIVILSLLTDIIGISKIIGIAGDPRFGPIQIAGVILGIC